eukprot:2620917-Amphidinium_carterae.1
MSCQFLDDPMRKMLATSDLQYPAATLFQHWVFSSLFVAEGERKRAAWLLSCDHVMGNLQT